MRGMQRARPVCGMRREKGQGFSWISVHSRPLSRGLRVGVGETRRGGVGWPFILGLRVEHVGARLIILGGGDGDGRADSLVTFGSPWEE